jgi:hypothetical protein
MKFFLPFIFHCILQQKNLSKAAAIFILVISGILSWIIANAWAEHNRMELGALMNFLVPQIIAAATLILFLLVDWILPRARFWVLLLLAILNVLTGIQIRIISSCC